MPGLTIRGAWAVPNDRGAATMISIIIILSIRSNLVICQADF